MGLLIPATHLQEGRPTRAALQFHGGATKVTLRKKSIRILLLALVVAALCVVPAFASSAGNVADAVEQTWTDAAGQIKRCV